MSDKHYNASYLEDTGRFLKELKEYSYSAFKEVASGNVIDLGCGIGLDVIGLSKMLGDGVKVIGVDHDQLLLDKGKESANGSPNVEFMLSEATKIPFEDGSVSGVRAERLIQHLKEPEAVFAEINRALNPGSPVVIVETDWPNLTFYNGPTAVERKINRYLTEVKINNGTAARKLTAYLEQSSFSNIRIEVFPFVLKKLADANQYLWTGAIIEEMKAKQELSSEEYDSFLSALTNADSNGYFSCSINLVVASATK
ncbi:MAG: hypothetical protein K0S09_2313 [Sphingobacteriaceae bacterium]|jgi:ubiquinone/menaquinone biosynthesis C-methylase UbiE|nr:hypothetical protein [Sphingobacteriaceae bacterium]